MRFVPSNKQLRHFELAKKLSKKSSYCHKLGAVIVHKGRVIGLGFNNPRKTHPKSTNDFKTVHAELSAVLNAGEDVKNCEIYIYRELKSGKPAKAKPCRFCEKLLRDVGIKTIYYTDDNNYSELSVNEET